VGLDRFRKLLFEVQVATSISVALKARAFVFPKKMPLPAG
jgi:hypothetical protein